MYNSRYSSLTYGQLEFLLTEMGYRQYPSTEPEWSLWRNSEFDILQILPSSKQNQPARIGDFITARKISIEKGILEPEEFEMLLQEAQQHKAEFAHTQDAA